MAWRAAGAVRLGDGPIAAGALFFLGRPHSHFGTGRNAGALRRFAPAAPTGKPDLDNLLKILDALNGLAFEDDAQIVVVTHLAKAYAEPDAKPRSVFELTAL